MSPHHQHIVFEHWFRRLYPMCHRPPSEVQQVLEIYTEKQKPGATQSLQATTTERSKQPGSRNLKGWVRLENVSSEHPMAKKHRKTSAQITRGDGGGVVLNSPLDDLAARA